MHWTYVEPNDPDLRQGDILAPTDELRDVLSEVHPHFCDEKYLGFIVVTQSCDLVRRNGSSKARYLGIAVIRGLRIVLPRLLGDVIRPIAPGLFRNSDKLEAKRFLKRLFDQNEQVLGLFYLHPDGDVGLGDPAVAFLRIKVTLRAQHYDVLVRARTGRLRAEFSAKLGWLIGNLYSRVASPDWSEETGDKKQLEEMVESQLAEQIPEAGPVWIDDALVAAGRDAGVIFEGRLTSELIAELEKYRPQSRIEQIVEQAVLEVDRVLGPGDEKLATLRNRLLNNGRLKKLSKVNS